jgi:hypothetical protein
MLPSGMPPLKFEQCSQNLLVGRGDSPGVCIGAYIKTGYRPIAPGAKLRARSQAILREADPLLMQALASFHTNDDDKDSDTLLNITLSNGPDQFAGVNGIIGLYHSDVGPFALNVFGEQRKSDIRRAGTVTTLKIIPDGNDTWRLNYFLDLVYFDGSRQHFEWFGLQLKEGRGDIVVLPVF